MKSHRTDNLSLFFGVAFLLVSGGYLASAHLSLELPSAGWFIAGALIFFGLVAAITALVPPSRPKPALPDEQPASDGNMLAE